MFKILFYLKISIYYLILTNSDTGCPNVDPDPLWPISNGV